MSLPGLDIPQLLRSYGLHPNKSLGQNFLQDESALRQVVEAARVTAEDVVLEVGPGLGSLTRHLAQNAQLVIAVELDPALIPVLKKVVAQFSNVRVVHADILALDLSGLVSQSAYLVVANIPYNITSALIRKFLEASTPPFRMVLTLQQEVARRICAAPGDMSLLSLSVQVYGQPEIVAHIPADAFYPPPRVASSILRIDRYTSPLIPQPELDTFFMLIKAGFSQKRKTLRNALAAGLRLSTSKAENLLNSAQIDPMRRAETLSLSEWHLLVTTFSTQFAST